MGKFPHQKLVVYAKALKCCAGIYSLTNRLPTRYWRIRDQMERASLSIPLNIAEGAGEFAANDRARWYRIARRSAAEVSAGLDLLEALGLISANENNEHNRKLEEIAAMLTTLVQVLGARGRFRAPQPRRSGSRREAAPSASPMPGPSPR